MKVLDFYRTEYGKGYLVFENNLLVEHILPGDGRGHLLNKLESQEAFSEGYIIPRKKGIGAHQMEKYFEGAEILFSDKIQIVGSNFEKAVYKACCDIAYGKTVTYHELAEKIGSKAYRAVGSALGKNKLPVFIPCHRVIPSSGKGLARRSFSEAGGWSGPKGMKDVLLHLEGVNFG